jgi:hypothetical protein
MHGKIKYEPNYQQIAILFNSKLSIVQIGAYFNKLLGCELSVTGQLESYDEPSDNVFAFTIMSFESEICKTTMMLIKNKGFSINNQPTGLLFNDETLKLQKHLIGKKKISIYSDKNLINTDYCFIISFPLGQSKPVSIISKIKKGEQIDTTIEIDLKKLDLSDTLMSEIEIHLIEYNKKNNLGINRRKILQGNSIKVETPPPTRIYFPNLSKD